MTLKCPHCEIPVPDRIDCPKCGCEWTIILDGNHSGFTEALGNVPLTRLLMAFLGWPDWMDTNLLCDFAKVNPGEAEPFLKLWIEIGIVKFKKTENEILFQLNNDNPIANQLELLLNVINENLPEE